MLNSTVLEVAIGLVFCYASLALMVSSVQEAIASLLKLRSNTLLNGIKQLLNDQAFTGLARDIYNNALINPTGDGKAKTIADLDHKPSYVFSLDFSQALIDALQTAPGNFDQLGEAIQSIPNLQLKQLLQGIYDRAAGNIEHFHIQIAAWFDSGMARLSGNYKRQSQFICFLIAFVFAVLFNIDSFQLFQTLWLHPNLAVQIGLPAGQTPAPILDQLWLLPIGWQHFPPVLDLTFVVKVLGWIVTASSAIFGAPFWFDLLQHFVQLRGTGEKPAQSIKTVFNKGL